MNVRVSGTWMAATVFAVAGAWPAAAQVSSDPCKAVNPDDIAALVTLNQATVEARQMVPGSRKCVFDVKPSLGMDIEVELEVNDLGSHEAAVHSMQQSAPFYFDKKPSLVKTNDAGDHVYDILQANGDNVTAVHGTYMVDMNVSGLDDAARAHPTWEYRMERTALQAAGATILPTPGVAPDPVLPKREAASKSVRDDTGNSGLPGIFGLLGYLWILGPLIAVFVLYRVFFAPRMLRKRLMATGLPGIARIDSVSDTGVTVNGSPQVKYTCTITPQTGVPYQASTKVIVSRLVAPASQVGSSAPVRIDPANPQLFTFVSK